MRYRTIILETLIQATEITKYTYKPRYCYVYLTNLTGESISRYNRLFLRVGRKAAHPSLPRFLCDLRDLCVLCGGMLFLG